MTSNTKHTSVPRDNPIWKSAEADAWSRDFSYQDYVQIICPAHKVSPVNEHMYKAMRVMFDTCIEYDMSNGL